MTKIPNVENYPSYHHTVVNSPQWLAWGKVAHEHGFDWDESVEIGALSSKHFHAFLSWAMAAATKEEKERILKLMYVVDVNKVPTIAEEAWANQYDHKAEAFWHGQAQYRKELEEDINKLTYD